MFSFSGCAKRMRPVPSNGQDQKYVYRKSVFDFLAYAALHVATHAAPTAVRPTDKVLTGMTKPSALLPQRLASPAGHKLVQNRVCRQPRENQIASGGQAT